MTGAETKAQVQGVPDGSGWRLPASARDTGLIPGLGRSHML